MRKIIVRCPICKKSAIMPIPKEIFEIEEGNLLKLPIREHTICEHRFLVIMDFHFAIRDYEIPRKENGYLQGYFERVYEKKRGIFT